MKEELTEYKITIIDFIEEEHIIDFMKEELTEYKINIIL